MSPPRFTHYELKLTATTDDGKKAIALLAVHLPNRYGTIAEANKKRRAIRELFGEHVRAEMVSVTRPPARRRVLRI